MSALLARPSRFGLDHSCRLDHVPMTSGLGECISSLQGEGPHQLPQKRSLALVSILQRLAAAEIANALHLRDFRSPAVFEFFNTICQKPTSRSCSGVAWGSRRSEMTRVCSEEGSCFEGGGSPTGGFRHPSKSRRTRTCDFDRTPLERLLSRPGTVRTICDFCSDILQQRAYFLKQGEHKIFRARKTA